MWGPVEEVLEEVEAVEERRAWLGLDGAEVAHDGGRAVAGIVFEEDEEDEGG